MADVVQRPYTNEELMKMDPFIKYWETNYSINIKNNVFSWDRARPLLFLINTMPYNKVPIILVAAGPSLDNNIHILKDYQDKCLIFCVDIVLFKLIENGIKPDFVINIDPHPETTVGWKDLEGHWYDTSDMILVCPTTANYESLCNWKGNIIFYNQTDNMKNHKGPFLEKLTKATSGFGSIANSFFIGATLFQFSSIFTPSRVMLVGYDFAYTDNKAFCDGLMKRRAIHQLQENNVPITQENIEDHSKALNNLAVSKRDLIAKLDDKEIPTTNTFKLYMDTLNSIFFKYKINVANCTEGGILSSIPRLRLEDSLKMLCKEEIKKYNIFDPQFLSSRRKRRRR